MSDIVIAVRTHVWNEAVNRVAREISRVFQGKRFNVVILADVSHGDLDIPSQYKVVKHSSNFSSFNLPSVPEKRSLWWNADYPMYVLQKEFSDHKFYLMIENDVAVTDGLDKLIIRYVDDGVDFLGEEIKKFPGYNGIQKKSTEKWEVNELWRSYIQLLGLSNAAITELLSQRLAIKNTIFDGTENTWPYCEIYIATALIGNSTKSFKYQDIFKSDLNKGNFSANDASPITDQRNWLPNSIAHPVLGEVDTVKKLLSSNSTILKRSLSSKTKLTAALDYIFSNSDTTIPEKKLIIDLLTQELIIKSPDKLDQFMNLLIDKNWIKL